MCWPLKIDGKPLYVVLRQYRVLPVAIILFFGWLTWDMTEWYQQNYRHLTEWQNAPIIGYLTSLIGVLKYALSHVSEPVKPDDIPER